MLPWITKNQNWLKATLLVVFLFLVAFLFFNFSIVKAQTADTFGIQPVQQSILLGSADIRVIIGKIVRAALGLLGVIATGIILYAGYQIMTSGGEEEKITKGKRTLVNAVIGLAIILSALAITQFILNALTTGNWRGRTPPPGEPAWDSFAGSGALGRVVKEHYPFRDQTDVPRNTKISVTFIQAVDPGSVIENTNATCWPKTGINTPVLCTAAEADASRPYYGDCILGDNFSWETNCDHIKNTAVSIYQSTSTEYRLLKTADFVQAAALAVYEPGKEAGDYNVHTFVFKPYNPKYLGSDQENVAYTVYLTGAINKKPLQAGDDPVSVFVGQYQQFYFWEFETGIALDLTPPTVKAVRPRANSLVPKNNIVQVYFSEPMDPTVTAGYLSKDSISHLFFDNQNVAGTWNLSSGYSVAEFISDQECGVNSCGEKMYCLPLPNCTNQADKNCQQDYQTLVRAGRLLNSSGDSFEAVPFSGVMDMAGNALDGNNNEKAEQRPDSSLSFADQKKPDNYYWAFIVQNRLDREAPVIETMLPEIDKEAVKGKDDLSIRFSKVMLLNSLYSPNTFLEEYPRAVDVTTTVKDVMGFYLRANLLSVGSEDKTELKLIPTRDFGPYHLDLYYFPQVFSQVKTETQNCFYPGRGSWGVDGAVPQKGTAPVCVYEENEQGQVIKNTNCIPVNIVSSTDTGCAETRFTAPLTGTVLQPDVAKCLETMEKYSKWSQ